MNKKTILEISLYAQYYRKDITDRYMINNKSLIITNDAIDILDKPQEKLYIESWTKKVEKDKEIERLSVELNKNMIERNNYLSRNEKANTLLDEMLERAYIDGEYIMYDYSTSELLEVKQALQGEDKDVKD